MPEYTYNDMPSQHICDHLYQVISEVALENDYTQHQILSFMAAVLVGTYEMLGMTEEEFHSICDRMKREFDRRRKLKTDSTTPAPQSHS